MRTEIQGDFKGYLTRFKMPSSKCFKMPIKSCLIIFLIQLVFSISFYMIENAPILQVLLLLECMFMVSYYIAVLYKDFWNVVLEESKGLFADGIMWLYYIVLCILSLSPSLLYFAYK